MWLRYASWEEKLILLYSWALMLLSVSCETEAQGDQHRHTGEAVNTQGHLWLADARDKCNSRWSMAFLTPWTFGLQAAQDQAVCYSSPQKLMCHGSNESETCSYTFLPILYCNQEMHLGRILWVSARVVQMLFGTTVFHSGVSGFDYWLQSQLQLPVHVGHAHPRRR